jgi:hypothetical protein
VNVHDASFDFLPHPIGKIAVGILKRVRNGEMLLKRDLALHNLSLSYSPEYLPGYLLKTHRAIGRTAPDQVNTTFTACCPFSRIVATGFRQALAARACSPYIPGTIVRSR